MTEPWLKQALAACRLPPPSAFPRDLKQEAALFLCLDLVELEHVTVEAVQGWLSQRGVQHQVTDSHSSMHGCMVAWLDSAAIFYDNNDNACEQRFTLAHELAHFVLDRLIPRTQALKAFGDAIRPVLDGDRRAEPDELLSSALRRIPLRVQVNLMHRGPSGAICSGAVAMSEWRADRLALELLAPASLALEMLQETPGEEGEARMAARFGLPTRVAGEYARMLLRRVNPPRFSIRAFLGEEKSHER